MAKQPEVLNALDLLTDQHTYVDSLFARLFPILRKRMDADTLAGLGNELLAMFEDLIKSAPRRQVPNETRRAAPLPA